MRVGCLIVPDLPLQARLRAEPDLAGSPLAIVDGPSPRAVVLCVSPEARREAAAAHPTGCAIRPGLTVTQARAICPSLVVKIASRETEQSAEAALRDVALTFSS